MSKINFSPVNTNPIRPGVSSGSSQIGGIAFQEKFVFPEIELEQRAASSELAQDRLNYVCLLNLFLEILSYGVDIIPTKPRDHGGFIVEASFKPAVNSKQHPSILIPARGIITSLIAPKVITASCRAHVKNYVEIIMNNSTDADIIRLIVVLTHEFGHFLSFLRGFHDKELKFGLSIWQNKNTGSNAANYTWLVFREECIAWKHAKEVLQRYKFENFNNFEKVKNQSLTTYLQNLKLEKASLDVYYKLSLLGEDFTNNCKSEFFDKKVV